MCILLFKIGFIKASLPKGYLFYLDEDLKFRSVVEAGNGEFTFRSAEDKDIIQSANGEKYEGLVVDEICFGDEIFGLRNGSWKADKDYSICWTKNTLFSERSYHH